MTSKTWVVELREGENGEIILPFPDDLMAQCGWVEDDIIDFQIRDDLSVIIINLTHEKRKGN